jgi:MFS family permease
MSDKTTKPLPRDFRLMVAGQATTQIGSGLLRFVLSLYILDITGRADVYATLYAISSIPLLLSPVGGALADRFDRRKMMVLIDFLNGLVVGSYAL